MLLLLLLLLKLQKLQLHKRMLLEQRMRKMLQPHTLQQRG